MDPIARDDAVGGPLVFDFEHHAFVRLVHALEGFCNHAVQAGAFELLEPLLRQVVVGRCGGEMHGRLGSEKGLLE